MFLRIILICCLFYMARSEQPVQGIKPTNVLGGADQHASFSFVRPGLTQTAFAFSGPSSHQSFSASIGNPHLVQKVLPSLAHALTYRNPGLGYFPIGQIANGYATGPVNPALTSVPLPYQAPLEQAMALAYLQQLHQHQPQYQTYQANEYQAQLAQVVALRQAQARAQAQAQVHTQQQQVTEQAHLQLEQQHQQQRSPQNLLGLSYSSAPSVAHVKVSGNGYKFDF